MVLGRCRRVTSLTAGVTLLVLLAGMPPQRAVVGAQASLSPRPYPVAIAPGNQHWPAASGDSVIWFDDMEGRPVIRANDLRTGNELRLSREGAVPTGPPAISGP